MVWKSALKYDNWKTNWQVVVVCYFMQIETQSRLNVVIKIVKGFNIETLFNEKRPFDLFFSQRLYAIWANLVIDIEIDEITYYVL